MRLENDYFIDGQLLAIFGAWNVTDLSFCVALQRSELSY